MLGSAPPVLREGRALALHQAGLLPEGVVVVNIYLESGVGINPHNYAILKDVARRIREYGRPFLIGGDFNCTREELEASGVLRFFNGKV
eukprot:300175-Pyramimonas_sp.AAC.1